jgi:D-tyrosyl-tRNA(Tyr) deacylase
VRVVLQRVTRASVGVGGEQIAAIGNGLLLFVGVGRGDGPEDAERLAAKIATLRVFADADGKTNLDITDAGGEALVVSQFTLYGDVSKGRRPSWTAAEDPPLAEERVEALAAGLESRGIAVSRGRFGADMAVELVNDGPLTLVLEAGAG